MNSRIWRFGLAAVATAALVVIGIVLLTGHDSGAQLSPSSSLAQAPQNATPAQTGPGTLVFSGSAGPGHGYDLYLVRGDGTGLKRLAAGAGNEVYAHWSPDGTRIVYASSGSRRSRSGIFVMNADGSGKLYLGDGADPSWSPDGKQILYDRFGIERLAVMNADGSGRRLVGVGAPFWPSFATWAPDGRIVFVRVRTSGDWSSGGDRPSFGGDLYAVNPDGSGLERLTKGASMTSPSVSPDGSTIAAYAAKTDRLVAVPYRADGPAVTLLERASQYFPTGGGMPMISSRWTSDGKKLVLGSDIGGRRTLRRQRRWLRAHEDPGRDGGDRPRLATQPCAFVVAGRGDDTPGRMGSLAYGLDGDIYVADWDGSDPVRIANGVAGGNGRGPAATGERDRSGRPTGGISPFGGASINRVVLPATGPSTSVIRRVTESRRSPARAGSSRGRQTPRASPRGSVGAERSASTASTVCARSCSPCRAG